MKTGDNNYKANLLGKSVQLAQSAHLSVLGRGSMGTIKKKSRVKAKHSFKITEKGSEMCSFTAKTPKILVFWHKWHCSFLGPGGFLTLAAQGTPS